MKDQFLRDNVRIERLLTGGVRAAAETGGCTEEIKDYC
jgi:hypothetical protein